MHNKSQLTSDSKKLTLNAVLIHYTEVIFANFLAGLFIYYHCSKSTGKETGKAHLCVAGPDISIYSGEIGIGIVEII